MGEEGAVPKAEAEEVKQADTEGGVEEVVVVEGQADREGNMEGANIIWRRPWAATPTGVRESRPPRTRSSRTRTRWNTRSCLSLR